MVSIPPHTSHKLQPLDLTFFAPLKNAYSRQCNLFLKSKISDEQKENKLTPYDVAEIFRLAYEQVANVEKGASGFSAAGIFPLNPEKFTEDDFTPAESFNSGSQEENLYGSPQRNGTPITAPLVQRKSPQPSTSRQSPPPDKQLLYFDPEPITVAQVLPIPKAKGTTIRKNMREKQHSQIITSTPFKDDLEKKEQKKNEKARNAAKKNIAKKSRKTNKKLKRKRTKLPDSDSETSSFDEKEIGDDDDLDNMCKSE
ncbi:uncharacterized protein LOC115891239 [Sitophilus oryzae]|uniref:Uncharacterized protein LOC115891239 n=1 Tax=Sitophilus oryzae TaxID=7048 RepID=A0A6J2YW89_SITOR|nr:uncharacterized protein LOC115891239 [Sitophilus oryzae]